MLKRKKAPAGLKSFPLLSGDVRPIIQKSRNYTSDDLSVLGDDIVRALSRSEIRRYAARNRFFLNEKN